MLDAVFVRVPNERNPGFLAVVVFFCRQFVFSGLAMIALVLGYLAFANPHLTEDPNFLVFGMILASGPLVFFEELGRYAFVRRAERPLRALAIYTAATAAVCALFFRNDLLVVAWTTGATVLASAALYWGLGHRRYLGYIVVALIVAHTTVYVVAPRSRSIHSTAPPRALSATPTDPSANLSPTAPMVGEMSAWAKLYPDARIVQSKTETLLGLTNWKVTYSVQASPDQIDAFYQQAARDAGFTDSQTLVGLHTFRQKSTDNDFRYMTWSDSKGRLVMFEARTFGRPPAAATP